MERKGLWIGLGATATWLAVYLGLTFQCGIPSMDPNEWGDWCAGLAAPIAFGWLVLGYLQQGDELRQSTAALNLQARELERSVKQQTALAQQAARQADLTEQSHKLALRTQIVSHQPSFVRFTAKNVNPEKDAFAIWIENVGRTCFNTRFAVVSSSGATRIKAPPEVRNWVHGYASEIKFAQVPAPLGSIIFTITYLDEVMAPQEQRFQLILKRFPADNESLSVSRIGMTFNPPDVTVPEVPSDDDDEAHPTDGA